MNAAKITLVAVFALSHTMIVACSDDVETPNEAAQRLCEHELDCLGHDPDYEDELASCIDHTQGILEDFEEDGPDCWDATVDALDCTLETQCAQFGDLDYLDDQCPDVRLQWDSECP